MPFRLTPEVLLKECANLADEKIKTAVETSERKQEEAMNKLREDMMKHFKDETKEMKSAVGAAGANSTNSQPNSLSKIDHKIGSGNQRKTCRGKDPGVLQFGGNEAVGKKQAAKVIEDTLSNLGISREQYTLGGPPRGPRFSVKFKEEAAGCTQPARPRSL